MKFLVLAAIRFYQLAVSPFLGENCRFHPSCSSYTYEAIRFHGVLRGSVLGIRRLFKCHPFNAGGFDPVPPVRTNLKH